VCSSLQFVRTINNFDEYMIEKRLDKCPPKGSILVECGKLLERNHYRIKVFNTINFKKSMHYNSVN
jgi:hypothetical protein